MHKLPIEGISNLGFVWPKYPLVEEYAVIEDDQIDLAGTVEKLDRSRAFYRGQLNAAFNFKQRTGADYSDFTDRIDEYARKERALRVAIAYLREIMAALEG
jgi:hypothetical protein